MRDPVLQLLTPMSAAGDRDVHDRTQFCICRAFSLNKMVESVPGVIKQPFASSVSTYPGKQHATLVASESLRTFTMV